MLKKSCLVICISFCLLINIQAQDFSDLYSTVTNATSTLIDPNAGTSSFKSLLIPFGGLAESMGSAYTAVAKDSSFFDYNPSASAILDLTEIAVYHNNWISDTKVEGAVYTMRSGSLGWGIAGKWLYLPFSQYDEWGDKVNKGYYSETTGAVNIAYNFFSGYYFGGLSIGANLKAAYRSSPDYTVFASDGTPSAGTSQSSLAVMADLGMLARFNFLKFYYSRNKNLSLGVALKNAGPAVMNDPLPTNVSAGLAYQPIKPVLISFDYSQPLNLIDLASSEMASYSVGTLVSITDDFAMQAGFLLKGANPRITLGSTITVDTVSFLVNYTLDLTTQNQYFNRISLQIKLDLGDGGRAAAQKILEELYLMGVEEYANGNTEKAIALWKEALKIDSGFDPARESIRTAEGAMNLQKRIEDIQKLESDTNTTQDSTSNTASGTTGTTNTTTQNANGSQTAPAPNTKK